MLMRYHYGLGVGHICARPSDNTKESHLPTSVDETEEHSPLHAGENSEPESESAGSDLLNDDSEDSQDGDTDDDELLEMYDMYGP